MENLLHVCCTSGELCTNSLRYFGRMRSFCHLRIRTRFVMGTDVKIKKKSELLHVCPNKVLKLFCRRPRRGTYGSAEESRRLPAHQTTESLEPGTHGTRQHFPERPSPGLTPVHYCTQPCFGSTERVCVNSKKKKKKVEMSSTV